jgi:hypothetical protein
MKGGNAAVNESPLIPKNGTLLELCPGSNEGFIGGGAGRLHTDVSEGSSWRVFCAGEALKYFVRETDYFSARPFE